MEKILTGTELVEKISRGHWFYNRADANSLVTDAKFEDGTLSYTWAGFSECRESQYSFSKAIDYQDGRIDIFANASFQRLNSAGSSSGIEERLVLILYDDRHLV